MRISRWIALAIAGGVIFLGLIFFEGNKVQRQWQARHAVFTAQLNSARPYQQVRIPFHLQSGIIYLNAAVSGKKVRCALDTGTDLAEAPTQLEINAYETGERGGIGDIGGYLPTQTAVIPDLKIGDLSAKNVWADRYQAPKANFFGVNTLVLSGRLFEKFVLTIDYRHNALIVRNANYDPLAGKDKSSYLLCDMQSHPSGSPKRYIRAVIAGKSFSAVVDTGFSGGVFISTKLYKTSFKKTLKPKAAQSYSRVGVSSCQRAPTSAKISSPKTAHKTLIIQGDVDIENSGDDEGGIGYALLHNFRVTFDYPRNRLILELLPSAPR